MAKPAQKNGPTAKHYILGYAWGKVEAFVSDDSITVQCLAKIKPSMLYEATINRPGGEMTRERSYIPDPERSKFLPSKDCDDPAELRPNIGSMLDKSGAPADVIEVLKKAYSSNTKRK